MIQQLQIKILLVFGVSAQNMKGLTSTKSGLQLTKSLRARDSHKIGKHAESKQHNCKTNLLIDFIPIDHVIIDTLLMFLRISDNLIELLIRELYRKDAIDKVSTFSNGFVKIGINSWLGMRNLLKNLELILNGKSIRTPRSWSTEILLDLKTLGFKTHKFPLPIIRVS